MNLRKKGIKLVVMLCVFLLISSCQRSNSEKNQAEKDNAKILLAKEINHLKEQQTIIKARLSNLEGKMRSKKFDATKEADQGLDYTTDNFINESINSKNVEERAIWKKTNKQNVYLVSIGLKKAPKQSSLFVWTGNGLLPFSAYKSESRSLSIMFNQSRENFIASNNFINIKYIPE